MTASMQLLRMGIAASAGPPPLSARQVVTDWREYPTNQRPAGWTYPHDAPMSTAIRVAGLSSAPTGRVLEWSTTGGSRDRYTAAYSGWSAYDGSAASQEQEVYGEFEVVSPTYSNDGVHAFLCGLMARIGGTGSSERGFRLVLHQTIGDGVKHLTLNAYVGGAYTELRTVPFAWEAGTGKVYAMRLKADGARLQGRVWERGTAEPVAWMIDYTLVDPTQIAYTGPPGLQFHEAAEVRCHRWGAGLAGESAPTGYPRPLASRTRQWFRSFGADALGGVPTGFSQLFQADGGRFRVVSDATAPDGRALEFAGQAGARGMYGLSLDEVGIVGDVELYAEVFVPAPSVVPNCRFGGLIARAGAAGSLWTGWGNDSRSDTGGTLFAASNFDRWVGSTTSTTLAGDSGFATTAGLVANQWTCLRIKVIRNQMFARYWPRGSAEPSTWWRTTDAANLTPTSATATGRVGLYTQEDRTLRWGCIGVGVDGMPAPTS